MKIRLGGSSGRVLVEFVEGPGFNPQQYKKIINK
jgi:hypothetical protein